jgi:hypothetical protein
MKAYAGTAQRIHVTATNEDFVNTPGATPDEVTLYDGAGSRVWKKVADPTIDAAKITTGTISSARLPEYVLSSTYFDGDGTTGDPVVPIINTTITDGSVVPATSNAVYDALDGKTMSDEAALALLGSTIKASPIGLNIEHLTTTAALADNLARFVVVKLSVPRTITGVRWLQGVQGSYTADGYNGVGLYSISGGTMTLVASSTNDGNIWKAASATMTNKDFATPYPAAAGVYVIAALYCQSAESTAPTIAAATALFSSNIQTWDFTNSVKLVGQLSGQTSLPSPQAMSGVTANFLRHGFFLY